MPIRYLILILFFQLSFGQIPHSVRFNQTSNERPLEDGLSSNGIVNIEILNGITIFLGTSSGLNIAQYNLQGDYEISHYSSNDNLPIGGNPALTIHNNIIAVSGLTNVETSVGEEQMGTGISYSLDGGEYWSYISQPKDDSYQNNPSYDNKWACPWGNYNSSSLYSDRSTCNTSCIDCLGEQKSCSMYDYISWGTQDAIMNFSVTTEVQNISYDLAVQGDYIYAASWAGSLRRFNYTDTTPVWEVVPLPMDNQDSLKCNEIDITSYQINPVGNLVQYQNDECGYEFDNHKVFSVYSIENTLWVGTAKGINKGIVDSDNCIDWVRMTSEDYGFYDDWIIGFEHQILSDGSIRLWAITWDRQYAGSQETYGGPPSYTDDGGDTWHVVDYFDEKDILTYNISSSSNDIYISTNEGAFIGSNSQDNNLWTELLLPDEITQSSIYDIENMDDFEHIWVGTSQGALVYDGASFTINSSESNINSSFYAYPNPYILQEDNDITFVFNGEENNINGDIRIYDYGMDRVIKLNGSGTTRWNGRNEYGEKVANGIYTCYYQHQDNSTYFFNIMVIKD